MHKMRPSETFCRRIMSEENRDAIIIMVLLGAVLIASGVKMNTQEDELQALRAAVSECVSSE